MNGNKMKPLWQAIICSMPFFKNPKPRGFTLIELIIAVAIVAIIATLAYPSYQDSVRKTRRSDARVSLTETAQRLERCFTQFNAYNHASCGVTFPVASPGGYYSVSVSRTATTFTLTAAPATGSPQTSDTGCTSMTMTQAGAKLPASCWN